MTEFEVELDIGAVRAVEGRAADVRPVLTEIGVYLLAQTLDAFRKQGLAGERWPARMVPNVPGIVSDLNRGRNPRPRRFGGRPALVDTGRLRQSFNFRVSRREVVVGTRLDYAADHQFGRTRIVELKRPARKKLAKFLKTRKGKATGLGWLFRKPIFEVRIRRRELVGIFRRDVRQIEFFIQRWMAEGDA